MSALAVVPRLTLYDAEESLIAFLDTAELVQPDQEEQFQRDFAAALSTAVEKRDRVGQFHAHLESQITLAKDERRRLADKQAMLERALGKVESYVEYTIRSLGTDSKGKYKKLEGKTTTFALHHNPVSVEILNESTIPPEFKKLTITLPAVLLDNLLDLVDLDERAKVLESITFGDVSVEKQRVKAAITSGQNVPGADLLTDQYSLRRT